MRTLIAAAQAGEWNRIDQIAESLVPAMAALQGGEITSGSGLAGQQERIKAVQSLLKTALESCATRKAQIAPLIDALDRAEELQAQP